MILRLISRLSNTRKKEERELITWFEIPSNDVSRAQKFYEYILRIKMNYEENEHYKTAFFPIYKDRIGGSIVQGPGYLPGGQGSKVFLNGHPDLQLILDRVEKAGGEILVPKSSIGKAGFFAWFKDSEGNKIALHSKK